ncbi:hypothetical protein [Spirosoma sp.]|uniref:hypothetical protein n=1 Tax=Spirosoma sp. TaxID=1899569 RepID=UPI003B3AAD8A
MKKKFTIKAMQTTKNILSSTAKNESSNLLKLDERVCCPFLPDFHGLAPKTAFSL